MWQALGACGFAAEQHAPRPEVLTRVPTAQSLVPHLLSLPGRDGLSSSTTADDVAEKFGGCSQMTIFIVGATSPIGRALCCSLAKQGASLVLGCRNLDEGERMAKQLSSVHPNCQAQALHCDLTSLQSTADAAASFQALGLPLHCLVLNASTFTASFTLSPDSVEQQFTTNYLAQCVLAQALLPLLVQSAEQVGDTGIGTSTSETTPASTCDIEPTTQQQSKPSGDDGDVAANGPPAPRLSMEHPKREGGVGRIVFVSCSSHYLSYKFLRGGRTPGLWRSTVEGPGAARWFMPVQGFALTKLAQLLYVHHLSQLLEQQHAPVIIHAVHPGLTQEGLSKFGGLQQGSWLHAAQHYFVSGLRQMRMLKSTEQAAASVAFAALAPCSLFGVTPQTASQGSTFYNNASPGPAVNPEQHPVSYSGRYLEDCQLSQPSAEARDSVAAAALWQVTQDLVSERLGADWVRDDCTRALLGLH